MPSTSSLKCLRHTGAQGCIRKTSNILLLDRNRHSWPKTTDVRGFSSHGNYKPCACLTSSAKSSSHLGIHPRILVSGRFAVREGGYTSVMQLASVFLPLQLHGPATAVLPPYSAAVREGTSHWNAGIFLFVFFSHGSNDIHSLAPTAAGSGTWKLLLALLLKEPYGLAIT